MSIRAARALCWMLAVMLPLSLTAADISAVMVQSKGSLMLNGKAVPMSVAAFAGDRLETAAGSQATLTMKGSTVLLAEQSALTVGNQELRLHSGSLLVTSAHQETRVNGHTIVPGAKGAKFVVNEEDGLLRIAALEGALTIHGASEPVTLEAGAAASRPSDAPASAPMATSFVGDDVGLIILIAGLITAGVIVGVVNSRDSATNPTP